jgi:hypothetical protein
LEKQDDTFRLTKRGKFLLNCSADALNFLAWIGKQNNVSFKEMGVFFAKSLRNGSYDEESAQKMVLLFNLLVESGFVKKSEDVESENDKLPKGISLLFGDIFDKVVNAEKVDCLKHEG